jgi:outer membrane protein TolC
MFWQITGMIVLFFAVLCLPFTSVAQTDSLNHYLQIAAQNNPGVKADFLAYQAALQKLPQAGAYQDPQLELGFFLQPMEIIDGRQVADIKLMQMFPWFGTKKAARTEAQHMAKMAFELFRETRDKLFLDVYTQWFTLCRLQQQLTNNRKNRTLLVQLEELALQRFASPAASKSEEMPGRQAVETGDASPRQTNKGSMGNMSMGNAPVSADNGRPAAMSGMNNMTGGNMMGSASPGMSDVLRIRLEITEIDNNIESLLSEIHAEKVKFNVLLNRPADSGILLPDSPVQIPFLFDLSSVRALITSQNPMLGMIAEEELAYQAKAEMDRKMSYPMFGIGLQYMLINKKATGATGMDAGMDADMNSMNGKDMIMPMLSVSIPVYRNKYKAQQRENTFLLQASREKYLNAQNMLEAELYRAGHLLDDAARRISLYRKQTELAQATCNLVVQEFASGKSGLSDVIQVQRQLLDYELKTSEAIADYNIMVANIRKLMSSNEE